MCDRHPGEVQAKMIIDYGREIARACLPRAIRQLTDPAGVVRYSNL